MPIIDLMEEALFKNAIIITTDGEVIKGKIKAFETAYDNDDTEASIYVLTDNDEGICLFESEIKEINIITGGL